MALQHRGALKQLTASSKIFSCPSLAPGVVLSTSMGSLGGGDKEAHGEPTTAA